MTVTGLAASLAGLDMVLLEAGQEWPTGSAARRRNRGRRFLACVLSDAAVCANGPPHPRPDPRGRFITGDGRSCRRWPDPRLKTSPAPTCRRLFVLSFRHARPDHAGDAAHQPRAECSQWSENRRITPDLSDQLSAGRRSVGRATQLFVALELRRTMARPSSSTGTHPAPPPPPNCPPVPIAVSSRSRRCPPGARADLTAIDCTWLAEGGVGLCHVAASTDARARRGPAPGAEDSRRWLLRRPGAAGPRPFGKTPPTSPCWPASGRFRSHGEAQLRPLPFLASAA